MPCSARRNRSSAACSVSGRAGAKLSPAAGDPSSWYVEALHACGGGGREEGEREAAAFGWAGAAFGWGGERQSVGQPQPAVAPRRRAPLQPRGRSLQICGQAGVASLAQAARGGRYSRRCPRRPLVGRHVRRRRILQRGAGRAGRRSAAAPGHHAAALCLPAGGGLTGERPSRMEWAVSCARRNAPGSSLLAVAVLACRTPAARRPTSARRLSAGCAARLSAILPAWMSGGHAGALEIEKSNAGMGEPRPLKSCLPACLRASLLAPLHSSLIPLARPDTAETVQALPRTLGRLASGPCIPGARATARLVPAG